MVPGVHLLFSFYEFIDMFLTCFFGNDQRVSPFLALKKKGILSKTQSQQHSLGKSVELARRDSRCSSHLGRVVDIVGRCKLQIMRIMIMIMIYNDIMMINCLSSLRFDVVN